MLDEGYYCVDVESDSLMLVEVLRGKLNPPWAVLQEIRRMKLLISDMDVNMFHVYRESNRIADWLANTGCKDRRLIAYDSWDLLPRRIKGFLNLDRLGLPNIRCKIL